MIREAVRSALLALACTSCVAPGGTTYVGFAAGVGDAPPPPRVVLVEEPAVAIAPGTSVYVVISPSVPYDMFRYGSVWYVYHGGYWYQASSHRGPFAVVDVRYVPRAVVTLPPRHWKHHPHGGPPGREKKHARRDD